MVILSTNSNCLHRFLLCLKYDPHYWHKITEPTLGRPFGYNAKHCNKSLLKKDFIPFLNSYAHSSTATCMFLPLSYVVLILMVLSNFWNHYFFYSFSKGWPSTGFRMLGDIWMFMLFILGVFIDCGNLWNIKMAASILMDCIQRCETFDCESQRGIPSYCIFYFVKKMNLCKGTKYNVLNASWQ
jgi:hypothetical protein